MRMARAIDRPGVRRERRATTRRIAASFGIACLVVSAPVQTQSDERPFRLGAVIARVASAEFETTETGVGLQFVWQPTPLIGAELEVVVHPADLGGRPAFSSGHVETLFGVTVGRRIGRWRPFAKLRPGILRFWQAPEAFGCMAIFPSPVRCTLAIGRTVVAADVGGGVELLLRGTTFIRLDVGDRLLSFPGPVRDSAGSVHEAGFFANDLRLAGTAGIRF
jgi:hypothetical protein